MAWITSTVMVQLCLPVGTEFKGLRLIKSNAQNV